MSKLVVIVGETASGKSELAMKLALKFNAEIVSADSWTVYNDFNIGTAKPSTNDQAKVTHHLLNIVDPQSGFNAAKFKKLAIDAINDINKRSKVPILTGGTGLYIDSLIYDYGFLPPSSLDDRQKLNALSVAELTNIIIEKNLSNRGIDMRNKRRLIRLVEANGQRPTKSSLRPNSLVIGLNLPSDGLESRIRARLSKMLVRGLETEVRALSDRYGWQVEPMKGIGYREWEDYFIGSQSLTQTYEQIVRSTMLLAKKQRTWFKRNKSIHWINNPDTAESIVSSFLNK